MISERIPLEGRRISLNGVTSIGARGCVLIIEQNEIDVTPYPGAPPQSMPGLKDWRIEKLQVAEVGIAFQAHIDVRVSFGRWLGTSYGRAICTEITASNDPAEPDLTATLRSNGELKHERIEW